MPLTCHWLMTYWPDSKVITDWVCCLLSSSGVQLQPPPYPVSFNAVLVLWPRSQAAHEHCTAAVLCFICGLRIYCSLGAPEAAPGKSEGKRPSWPGAILAGFPRNWGYHKTHAHMHTTNDF